MDACNKFEDVPTKNSQKRQGQTEKSQNVTRLAMTTIIVFICKPKYLFDQHIPGYRTGKCYF